MNSIKPCVEKLNIIKEHWKENLPQLSNLF